MQLSHIATLPAEVGFVIQARLYGSAGMLDAKISNDGGLTGTCGADHPVETYEIPTRFMHNANQGLPSFPRLLDMFANSPVGGRLFIESIRDNQHPVPSFYEGWKAQQILDAAIESNRTGRWVEVNPPAGR
jgi:predicted dehydrogenase